MASKIESATLCGEFDLSEAAFDRYIFSTFFCGGNELHLQLS